MMVNRIDKMREGLWESGGGEKESNESDMIAKMTQPQFGPSDRRASSSPRWLRSGKNAISVAVSVEDEKRGQYKELSD